MNNKGLTMKLLSILILLTSLTFGQSGKSVLSDAQKDSVGAMISDSLNTITLNTDSLPSVTTLNANGDVFFRSNNLTLAEKRPIISFVFDDDVDSAYSIFRPIYANRNVKPSISILNPPTAGQKTKILTLQSEGWEVETHINAQTYLTDITRDNINNYLDSIKNWHYSQGYIVKNGNWLGGYTTPMWSAEVRKYYRSARLASGSGAQNNIPINQYALGSHSMDNANFNYWVTLIDQIIEDKAWGIFYTHSAATQWIKRDADGNVDAGGLYNWQWIDSLIGYIQAKPNYGDEGYVIILPKDQALDYTENVIEAGNYYDYDSSRTSKSVYKVYDANYFKVSRTGEIRFPNSEYLTTLLLTNTNKDTAGIQFYPQGVSYMLTDAGCIGCAYPTTSGTLITYNVPNESSYRYQIFRQTGSSVNTWMRGWTGSAWGSWQQIVSSKDMLMWAINGGAAETTFNQYNLKGVSRFSVSSAGWNFPATNGLAIIDRTLDDFANMRWFMEHNNNKLWFSGGRSTTNQDFVRVTSQTATKTYTINFDSLAANTTVDSTITLTPLNANVSDASVGDVVIASPNETIEGGLVWSAWVSATNKIKLRLANITATGINPASRSWTIIVVKQ